jgi:hypothetical protein
MTALIRQAIRELHIDIEPHNRQLDIQPVLAPTTEGWSDSKHAETTAYMITGTNRKGDPLSLKIDAETPYPKIVDQLKAAWKGQ